MQNVQPFTFHTQIPLWFLNLWKISSFVFLTSVVREIILTFLTTIIVRGSGNKAKGRATFIFILYFYSYLFIYFTRVAIRATVSYFAIWQPRTPIIRGSASLEQIWSYFRSKSATSARKGCVVWFHTLDFTHDLTTEVIGIFIYLFFFSIISLKAACHIQPRRLLYVCNREVLSLCTGMSVNTLVIVCERVCVGVCM